MAGETLTQDWQAFLEDIATSKLYRVGDPIAFQGEPAEHIGYMTSGTAKAIAYSEDGVDTWLGEFQSGEFFGHTSFLTQKPVNFEITAQTDMTALIIPASALPALLDTHRELNRAFAEDLAKRLDMMMNRLVEALTLSAKGRVCAELMRLSRPIGIEPDKSIIRPNPVFIELALRVNSTRETVSRTVSELQKKGILTREPGALLVQNRGALKAAIR